MANLNSGALRILCLHDGESNAMELSDSLEVLGERLFEKHGIDLVYVNAPLISKRQRQPETQSSFQNRQQEVPNRVWWEEEEGEQAEGDQNHKFVGLDASLLLLKQVWNSMPFWGILAIGKGAAIGSFLPLLPVSPVPSFCIFVHGESLLQDEQEKLIDNLSCLHIIDTKEDKSGGGKGEMLIQQFGGQVHKQTTKKLTKSTLNVMGKFIIAEKKRMRENTADASILALQNQLYLAEQEAASIVAQKIAADPPKALMAIISPQNVGGWSGGKRRGPNDEGGGAPCPPEFLLNREKRTTDPHGPTRQKPIKDDKDRPEEEEDRERNGDTIKR